MALDAGIRQGIERNVGDMVHHADSIISQDIYALNHDFYEGYMWVAALDSATCLVCAALSNKIFKGLPNFIEEFEDAPPDEPNENTGLQKTLDTMHSKMPEYTWDTLPDSIKQEIERKLKSANIELTGKEFIEFLDEKMASADLVRHQSFEKLFQNIESFEKDAKIKTLFETNTSEGSNDKAARNWWELRLLGYSDEEVTNIYRSGDESAIAFMNDLLGGVENRPIYGEVAFQGLSVTRGGAARYGELHLVLSNSIRKNASFTSDNSSGMHPAFFSSVLQSIATPRPNGRFDGDNMDYFTRLYYDLAEGTTNGIRNTGYTETQIWGGISLKRGDVKEVVISEAFMNRLSNRQNDLERVLDVFRLYNINIRLVDK